MYSKAEKTMAGFGLQAPKGLQNWPRDISWVSEFWNIQEILYLIGTKISQFRPREADIQSQVAKLSAYDLLFD